MGSEAVDAGAGDDAASEGGSDKGEEGGGAGGSEGGAASVTALDTDTAGVVGASSAEGAGDTGAGAVPSSTFSSSWLMSDCPEGGTRRILLRR